MAGAELTKRVVAGLVLAPVAVAAGWYGDWALAALLSVASALAAWELFRIARSAGAAPLDRVGIVLAALIPLIVHAQRRARFDPSVPWTPVLGVGVAWACVGVLAILAATIWLRGTGGKPIAAAATTVFGVVYTGGMLSFAYGLRYHPYTVDAASGAVLLLFPLLLTWTTDTGAYAVGRTLGRRKLIPSVSPGKSVEGAIGGLVLAMIVAWLYHRYVMIPKAHLAFAPGAALLVGAVISVADQVGDLAESLLKREAGVKDSSHIIPGHGGVLDRVDSLLFTLPVMYWLMGLLRVYPVPS